MCCGCSLTAGAFPRSCCSGRASLPVFLIHSIPHHVVQIVVLVPFVVVVNDLLGRWVRGSLDFELEVVAEMAFARHMGEKMADIGEIGLARADIAMERDVRVIG